MQPFDTSLLTNFSQLYPEVVKAGQVDGQQYWIPWDCGYSSVLYRTDKIDPADATELGPVLEPEVHRQDLDVGRRFTTPVVIAGLVNGGRGSVQHDDRRDSRRPSRS